MSTLLLRFAGPMQAWGVDARFDVCRTNREPTKSGVIGLLAAALGLRRDAPLDDLTALRFGVRVDREGQLLRDLHMVHGEKDYRTMRYYHQKDGGAGQTAGRDLRRTADRDGCREVPRSADRRHRARQGLRAGAADSGAPLKRGCDRGDRTHFHLNEPQTHRALADCRLTYGVLEKLKAIR